MKKLLIALVLGAALVLALGTTAMADNGPHGSFTATTDACASCHRAHSAQYGSNSLLIMDPEALCLSCHDGTGAGTNVEMGVYAQAGATAYYGGGVSEGVDGVSLYGGGFADALMATAWSGAATAIDCTANPTNPLCPASRPTTSSHNIGSTGTVWGSGAVNTANQSIVLECTNCHDPHGTAGYQNVTPAAGIAGNLCSTADLTANPCSVKYRSYRLLRWQPNGSGGFTAPTDPTGAVNWSGGAFPGNGAAGAGTQGWTVPDNFAAIGTEWYTLGATGAFVNFGGTVNAGDYNAGNANNVYNIKNAAAAEATTNIPAAVNVAYFCAQCHDRYFANSRLRNRNDASAYCGAKVAGVVVGTVTLTVYAPDANGLHPVDPIRCGDAYDNAGVLITTYWGDNGDHGDTTYRYMHSSGDIRASQDGTVTAGGGTSVSRSCVACHVAHGTAADMTAFADGASLATGSTLLRMDNRSLCLRCHANTVNFIVGP